MALTYNAGNKTWSNVAEKTDYDTSRETGAQLYKTTLTGFLFRFPIVTYSTSPGESRDIYGAGRFSGVRLGTQTADPNPIQIDSNTNLSGSDYSNLSQDMRNEYQNKQSTWRINAQANADSSSLNEQNTKKNNFYNGVNNIIAGTNNNQYTYLQAKEAIARAASDAGVSGEELNKMVSPENGNFRTFYANEKVPTWDTALGAKPLYGAFDAKYYKEQRPDAANAWKNAVNQDDLDVIQRYDENSFYLQDYSTTGKAQGIRGNRAEITQASNAYLENYDHSALYCT